MDKSLYKFIIRHTKKQQIILLFITILSFPFLYVSLELPKIIINEAIGGSDFPKDLYIPFLGIDTELWQVEFLFALSLIFLCLVLLNGLFKYSINVYKGHLGEKMLKYFRSLLFNRIISFPITRFKRIRQGEIISIITAEVEPLGGFIGDALALPVFQGGTLLVYIGFIFVQDPILGLAAISLYPIQIYIIPKLQKQVNLLAKKRIHNVRILSSQLGETMSGIKEIYVSNTAEYEQNRIDNRLNRIFNIRYDIFKKKFFIKFLNNLMSNLTPFFFFSIGGYLVIEGQLTSGALVAVLAAYKDLSSPWKELLQYYQQKEDVKIKYQQIIDQFQISEEEQERSKSQQKNKNIEGILHIDQLTIKSDEGKNLVDQFSDNISLELHTCIIGTTHSGIDELTMALSGLVHKASGRILIDDTDLNHISREIKGEQITYIDQSPYILSGTFADNLFYSFMTSPIDNGDHLTEPQNIIDFKKAKCITQQDLDKNIINIMKDVELYDDIYQIGLHQYARHSDDQLKGEIVKARKKLYDKLVKNNLEKLIEPFNENTYNANASLIENITFGTLRVQNVKIETIAENSWLITVLRKMDLYDELVTIGYKASQTLTEIFLSSEQTINSQLIEKFSFVNMSKLKFLKTSIIANHDFDVENCTFSEQVTLLSIAFQLIVNKHRLGIITKDIQNHVIKARKYFVENLPSHLKNIVDFFHPDRFNEGLNCQNNILYGHISYNIAHAKEKVETLIDEVLTETNIKDSIHLLGLYTDVGTAGAKLTIAQRQKLSIASALLKRPQLIICNQALNAIDSDRKKIIIQNILQSMKGKAVIWTFLGEEYTSLFDNIIYMENGKKLDKKEIVK